VAVGVGVGAVFVAVVSLSLSTGSVSTVRLGCRGSALRVAVRCLLVRRRRRTVLAGQHGRDCRCGDCLVTGHHARRAKSAKSCSPTASRATVAVVVVDTFLCLLRPYVNTDGRRRKQTGPNECLNLPVRRISARKPPSPDVPADICGRSRPRGTYHAVRHNPARLRRCSPPVGLVHGNRVRHRRAL